MSDTTTTKRSRRQAMGPFGPVGKIVDELDDRLGVAKGGRVFLDKIFPDHWSFMLGEISLYSFVVLLATGVFLSLYYIPSATGRLPRRVQAAGRAVGVEAYSSTVNISFDVRGGLLMRQMHHWAADIFTGSIVVHMARIFFTGAFRKPRELNWIIGLTMLILAIFEGFIGYSLPDDLISGTGLRIGYSIVESIPLGGQLPGVVPLGRPIPGQRRIIPRFFIIHVLIIPLVMHRAAHRAPGPAGPPEAHAVPRRGSHRAQRGRLADVPDVHGQDHRLLLHGRGGIGAARRLRPDQPDLAVRLLRRVQDLLRRAARLVHGLARRRAAHHAVVGVHGRRPYHPLRGLPAGRGLPRPDLHHLLRRGR